LLTKFAKDLMD